MTKPANILAIALVSMSALIATATVLANKSPVPSIRLKPAVQQPRWIEIEAEPVGYSNPAPIKHITRKASKGRCNGESCKAPRKGEETNRVPCKRGNVWMLCSQVVYTQLEQGGSPTAEYVARID